jgi:polyisoprenoid-binding protein YceI
MLTTFQIDPSHSSIEFSIRHLVIAKVRGRFTRFRGTIALDDDIARSTVNVEIDAGSIHTNDDQRDGHLRSADFFDAVVFPHITFASHRVERRGTLLRVMGALTLHGVTRDVMLDAEQLGMTKDLQNNQRIVFSARASIDRKDFGLSWNRLVEAGGVAVGDRVEMGFDIEAVRVGPSVATLAEGVVTAPAVHTLSS